MFDHTVPAPGEDSIPPAPVIDRAQPHMAGCWVGGHHGQYGPRLMVSHAMSWGWRPDAGDAALIAWEADADRRDVEDLDAGLSFDAWQDLTNDVEQWLTDNVAPEGYSFGWFDGEFFLASCAWWAQDDEDEPDGGPVDINGKPLERVA